MSHIPCTQRTFNKAFVDCSLKRGWLHSLDSWFAMSALSCRLLGGTFALVVQSGLGASAMVTLAYKRATERPRRPLVVWAFDASKQGFAGVLQHGVNLGCGVFFAMSGRASEFAWYLTNFTVSVACGVVILWALMLAYKRLVERFHLTLLRSGEYGSPPSWKPWLAQLLAWGFLSSVEKLLTAVLVIVPLHRHLDSFAAWLERPVRGNPAAELVLVMVIAPVALNAWFFWIVDNLIMRSRGFVGRGSEGDDRPHDERDSKEPLLDGSAVCGERDGCGCIPAFSPTRPVQADAGAISLVASCSASGGGSTRRSGAATPGTRSV